MLFLVNVIYINELNSCLNETPDKFLSPTEISCLDSRPVYFLVYLTFLVCFQCFSSIQCVQVRPCPPQFRPQPALSCPVGHNLGIFLPTPSQLRLSISHSSSIFFASSYFFPFPLPLLYPKLHGLSGRGPQGSCD